MTDKLLIERELLEVCDRRNSPPPLWAVERIRAILAAPRQPEGEGLEVVAGQFPEINFSNYGQDEVEALQAWGFTALDAMSDAQRAIAELREECERLREAQKNYFSVTIQHGAAVAEAQAERDTLRQQLAERDAEIDTLKERLSSRAAEHCDDLADKIELEVQRDKLAGLLREVRDSGRYASIPDEITDRIDAALVEVEKK